MSAPERIWASLGYSDVGRGFWDDDSNGDDVEYVRADLYDHLRARLATAEKRAWDEGRQAAAGFCDEDQTRREKQRDEESYDLQRERFRVGAQQAFQLGRGIRALPNPCDKETGNG